MIATKCPNCGNACQLDDDSHLPGTHYECDCGARHIIERYGKGALRLYDPRKNEPQGQGGQEIPPAEKNTLRRIRQQNGVVDEAYECADIDADIADYVDHDNTPY